MGLLTWTEIDPHLNLGGFGLVKKVCLDPDCHL